VYILSKGMTNVLKYEHLQFVPAHGQFTVTQNLQISRCHDKELIMTVPILQLNFTLIQ